MKKINVIGERAKYWFKNIETGEVLIEYSTAEDYNRRFLGSNDNPPEKNGHKWFMGKRAVHFDTPDGEIHPGEYASLTENQENRVITVLSDGLLLNLPKTELEQIKNLPEGKEYESYKKRINPEKVKEIKEIILN